jgi:hypothetical protein
MSLSDGGEDGQTLLAANIIPTGWQKTKLPARDELARLAA